MERPEPITDQEEHPVVYFDGVCGLCNRSVDLLLRWDKRGVLRFSPLQGRHAAEHLPGSTVQDLDSIVLVDQRGAHTRSDAVVRALEHLGGLWHCAAALRIVPRSIRDAMYRLVARYRYTWFGQHEQCRMPTFKEAERFLP